MDWRYKKLLEEPIASNHAENEGIFSDALGPLDTYYPLVRVEDEEDDDKRKTHGRSGRAVYRKPKNIANAFATGHAEAYDPGMDALADRLTMRSASTFQMVSSPFEGKW